MIHTEDKKKCGLTFKFSLDVPFSLSIKEADAERFKQNVGNNNNDVSKILRDILFKEMKITSKRELDIFLAPATDTARNLIYTKIGASRTNSFSKTFEKVILKFNRKYRK